MVTKYFYKNKEITYSEKLEIEAKLFREKLKLKNRIPAVHTVEVDESLDECLDGAWWNMMF